MDTMTGWTHWNLVVSEEGRGIPGLDIWDNLAPHITLERVLSPVSQPESHPGRLVEVAEVRDSAVTTQPK